MKQSCLPAVSFAASNSELTNYQTIDIEQEDPNVKLNQIKISNGVFLFRISCSLLAIVLTLLLSFRLGSYFGKQKLTEMSRVTCSATPSALANIEWLQSSAVPFCKVSCKDSCSSYEVYAVVLLH